MIKVGRVKVYLIWNGCGFEPEIFASIENANKRCDELNSNSLYYVYCVVAKVVQ